MIVDIKRVKIFVTTPKENWTDIRDAVCKAGAGTIGKYSFCTFSCNGVGTFKPDLNANPYIGEINKLEFVDECKSEFVCEIEKVAEAISTLRKVHPYEGPAIDIIPLIQEIDFKI